MTMRKSLTSLCERLINLGVLPYYLHQLDRVQGTAHFEVPVERGLALIAELRCRLPGYAVPQYVRSAWGRSTRCRCMIVSRSLSSDRDTDVGTTPNSKARHLGRAGLFSRHRAEISPVSRSGHTIRTTAPIRRCLASPAADFSASGVDSRPPERRYLWRLESHAHSGLVRGWGVC